MVPKVGQTWQLPNGEIVTIVSVPSKDGWLRAFSHDVGGERTYGSYVFAQKQSKLVEVGRRSAESDLREILKQLVREVIAEQKE